MTIHALYRLAKRYYRSARLFVSLLGCEDYDGSRVGVARAWDIAKPPTEPVCEEMRN